MIEGSKDGYPELDEKKDFIFNVLNNEEKQFNKTIDQGLSILAELEEKMAAEGSSILSGDDAFKLYDTYGFPLDLTREILAEKDMRSTRTVSRKRWKSRETVREPPVRRQTTWARTLRFTTRSIRR